MSYKRKPMHSSNSRQVFTRGAMRVHRKNGLLDAIMRGGIRL